MCRKMYYITSAYPCLKAFLQRQLNKIFSSPALDDDLDSEEVPIPAEPAAGNSRTGKHNLEWAKIVYCLSINGSLTHPTSLQAAPSKFLLSRSRNHTLLFLYHG
ncbi:hypothetical protein DVH24_038047 [Malus domestica]|uniref:Uncharacterized protein n=1 Tax=Malus domestica TaxID=3750 RepID=A0A498KE83_MALDO|nr:hypothetical protein DVH24_038047 [Malus domestica]